MSKSNRVCSRLLVFLLVGCLAVAAIYHIPSATSQLAYAVERGNSIASQQQLETATDLSQAFQYVAKALRPSVVSISSVRKMQPLTNNQDRPRSPMPDELRRFFGNDFFDRFEFNFPSPPRSFEHHGLGTGVIVSEDGYILTNHHVVAEADELKVSLSDGRDFTAEIIGTDKPTDLAVLKIGASDLVTAKIGDSSALQVGEWALAIGSPFGLEQTVTAGIISATGRANVGIADYEDFVQTDAAINPGNSGGPLVNLKGEVVGINTAIASRSGGYMGVGFAIPSAMAKSVMDSLIDNGQVERGWLGAVIQDLNEDLATSFGYDGADGVLIGDVVTDGPAAKAGRKAGDILIKFDGKKMKNTTQLRNAVAATEAGSKVKVLIHRDGDEKTITVDIAKLEGEAARLASGGSTPSRELGINVQTLDSDLANDLGYDSGTKGVVVTAVEPGSVSHSLGVRPKDVIVSVGNTKVENVNDFRDAMKDHDLRKGIRLQVMRDNVSRFLFARAAK